MSENQEYLKTKISKNQEYLKVKNVWKSRLF